MDSRNNFAINSDINEFDPAIANKIMVKMGIAGHLDIKYSSHGDDWVELKVDWRPDLTENSDSGELASAVIIAVLDNATSISAWQKRGQYEPQVTMDLRLDYLRPSPSGQPLYGRGICHHLSQDTAFVRGFAHNGDAGDPLAFVTGTFVRLGG